MPILSFLSPIFLIGLATAAIPVVIHLIHRRRTRQVPFSTLMFLRMAYQRTSRRRRLRELFMMALRCLLLVLLALAFARPRYAGALLGRGEPAGDEGVDVAIVLDDSFSMRLSHEGTTSFERAREAAVSIVDSLPPGSEVVVVAASGNSDWEIPEPTPNLLQVRRALQTAAAGARAPEVRSALARADRVLPPRPGRPREFYVLTDLQRNAWRDGSAAQGSEAGEPAPAEPTPPMAIAEEIVVVDCGARNTENLAVVGLAVKGSGTDMGDDGAGLSFTATVHNFGSRARAVTVSLRTGAKGMDLRAEERASVPKNGAVQLALRKALAPGSENGEMFRARVALPPDALPIDDVRYFAAAGPANPRVLLVTAARPRRPGSDLFYVHTALNLDSAPFEVFHVSPAEIETMRLDETSVAVMGGAPGVSPDASAALHRYVRDGGGLLLFCGPEWRVPDYNQFVISPEGTMLPRAMAARTAADDAAGLDGAALTWEDVDVAHPVFEAFAGLGSKELGFVRTQGYLELDIGAGAARVPGETRVPADPTPTARILARYSDGAAAIVEAAYGKGRVLLFTMSCDGGSSNFPLRASFVPILHRAVSYLAETERKTTTQHVVGQPIEMSFPVRQGPVPVEITSPDGAVTTHVSEADESRNRLIYHDTDAPGIYAINIVAPMPSGDARVPPLVAVNVDPDESNLERLSKRGLRQILPNARIAAAEGVVFAGARGGGSGGGVELWGAIIALLVAGSLLESTLASLFSPRRGQQAVRARSLNIIGVAPGKTSGGGSGHA